VLPLLVTAFKFFGGYALQLGFTVCHHAMMAALKEARVAAGISGRALSLKLRKPYNYVSKIERGQTMPNYCQVMQYLDAIGADPVEFARRHVEISGPRRRKRSAP
jgi:transcriptional regulator with XRE-family HTH domain